jgi:hypothetical protein
MACSENVADDTTGIFIDRILVAVGKNTYPNLSGYDEVQAVSDHGLMVLVIIPCGIRLADMKYSGKNRLSGSRLLKSTSWFTRKDGSSFTRNG